MLILITVLLLGLTAIILIRPFPKWIKLGISATTVIILILLALVAIQA